MVYLRAIGRAFALAAFSLLSWLDVLVELVTFALLCGGLVFFFGPAVEWARGRSAAARTLAARWCGVEIAAPYRPEPPEPVRERDGWYRDGNQLYKRAFWISWQHRLTWVMEDPATGREFTWQLVNPLLTLLLPVAVLLGGPAALRGHGRWTRWMLGPRPPVEPTRKNWLHRHLESLGHQFGILALSLVQLIFSVFQLAVFGVATPLAAPVVLWSRSITDTLRREAENWTGVRIPRPYLPPPALPVPRADGLYQVGRQLHEEPFWPVQLARRRWILRDRATWRDIAGGGLSSLVSLACSLPALVAFGWAVTGLSVLWVWRPFVSPRVEWFPLPPVSTHLGALAQTPLILLAVVIAVAPAPWLARQQARFARLWFGPTESSRLAQRVERLKQTRSDVTVTQAAELRRIERDLHDGIQSRLVAMGMKLGAVEALVDTDPAAAKRLAAELRAASSEALTELRVLIRGIHPPVLSERGLLDAVRALAMDSPLKSEVTGSLPGRVEEPVEACVYFAVSELLGNAAKHGAKRVSIEVEFADGLLTVVVTDEGPGGANPARGSGLRGIERRLGAFDGRLTLTSPIGGPTKATLEIPCQLDLEPSSPRTSTSSETA
ncbi:two-component system histidine kinase [Amycolatopsis mediterranei S699]|uniref:histidine kinase n=2 Tax=Amycolatopsis mediterranei TaxID=33910 RepID=A0A0H3CUC2_AMYMU|nr:histidine kinase [Amycolatopsis mediterranei]ADJ41868.1 two-component system histidine kinase [Amycolatopsis mediterranei U32]AEK38539.1 two-component system histidine kinase [Amycolatopsis mediterranei S699]AFO73578.1 two-component system histidine kinase [Amycolatopsis mediterranei S699]AGT80707.1 two-component system histidine kinase [Amycolatopsis mediterranei RB]KDO09014.1 histidine kinase [Amycolatopsis mediterranei]